MFLTHLFLSESNLYLSGKGLLVPCRLGLASIDVIELTLIDEDSPQKGFGLHSAACVKESDTCSTSLERMAFISGNLLSEYNVSFNNSKSIWLSLLLSHFCFGV